MQGKIVIAAGALVLLVLSATAEARGWSLGRPAAGAAGRAASATQHETHRRAGVGPGLRHGLGAAALVGALVALPGCGASSDRSGALVAWFVDFLGIPGVQVGPAPLRAEVPSTSAPVTAEIGAETVASPVRGRGARQRL